MEKSTEQPPRETGMHARIERYAGNHAVLITDDAQTVQVRKECLPTGIAEGSDVWLVVHTEATRETERRKNARALLDEILNPENL